MYTTLTYKAQQAVAGGERQSNAERSRAQRIGALRARALLVLVGAAVVGLWGFAAAADANLPPATSFTSTGEHPYVVPAGVTAVRVEAVGGEGAAGSSGLGQRDGSGGFGAHVFADIPVVGGETLYVEVGGNTTTENGGFNGGGTGGPFTGGGGGGASDVRTCSATALSCAAGTGTLASRLVVAGGGGGGGAASTFAGGGDGGSAASPGHDGAAQTCTGGSGGGAGTSDAGGAGGAGATGTDASCATTNPAGSPGSFGSGGNGAGGNGGKSNGGGGGGGWLGGGGGGSGDSAQGSGGGGGGGGANFVTNSASNVTLGTDDTGTPKVVITPVQGPPSATTQAATGGTASGATLNGTANPNGVSTDYRFEYGTTSSYGSITPSTSAGSGTSDQPALATVSGLAPNTTYHFRIVATSSAGTSSGADQMFTTQATSPLATTGPASDVTASSATLNGTVSPGNSATSYRFDYGTTAGYGSSTAAASAGSDGADHQLSQSLPGLSAGTSYHYRIVATNSAGTTNGADRTFTTQAAPAGAEVPAVSTGSVSDLGPTSAALTGALNPNGQGTSYHFDYGPTTSYGASTPTHSGGSGGSLEQVSAALSGLKSNTTYHYRLVGTSSAGTSSGGDRTFTTPRASFQGATVPSQRARLNGNGDIRVRLVCPKGTDGSCAGTIALRLLTPNTPRTHASFTVRPGGRSNVSMHLSPSAQAQIRRSGHIVALATITSHDAAGTRKVTFALITLAAPRPTHRR